MKTTLLRVQIISMFLLGLLTCLFAQTPQIIGPRKMITPGKLRPLIIPDSMYIVTWDRANSSLRSQGQERDIFVKGLRPPSSTPLSERQVNQGTNPYQEFPAIARRSNGDFVIAWVDGSAQKVRARGYHKDGTNLFGQIEVGSTTRNEAGDYRPAIAMNDRGDFVIVWIDIRNGEDDIYASIFSPDGTAWVKELQVDFYSSMGNQTCPQVAMNESGDVVFVWQDNPCGNSISRILAWAVNIYTTGGEDVILFDPIVVNKSLWGNVKNPSVGMSNYGDFVVVWESGDTIKARGFSRKGDPIIQEMQVSTLRNPSCYNCRPDIAVSTDGSFDVVWSGGSEIYARGFNSDGSDLFYPITMAWSNKDELLQPRVAINQDKRFVVVWNETDTTGSPWRQSIRSRGYNKDGSIWFGDARIWDYSGQQIFLDVTF